MPERLGLLTGEAPVHPAGALFPSSKQFWDFLDMSHLGNGRFGL